jgi:hypothetical protein
LSVEFELLDAPPLSAPRGSPAPSRYTWTYWSRDRSRTPMMRGKSSPARGPRCAGSSSGGSSASHGPRRGEAARARASAIRGRRGDYIRLRTLHPSHPGAVAPALGPRTTSGSAADWQYIQEGPSPVAIRLASEGSPGATTEVTTRASGSDARWRPHIRKPSRRARHRPRRPTRHSGGAPGGRRGARTAPRAWRRGD